MKDKYRCVHGDVKGSKFFIPQFNQWHWLNQQVHTVLVVNTHSAHMLWIHMRDQENS